jgi:hypothetical protein
MPRLSQSGHSPPLKNSLSPALIEWTDSAKGLSEQGDLS